MITIGLLWHSLSSGNLGVGALTESSIAIIRQAAESQDQRIRFLVLGTGSRNLPSLAAELEGAGHLLEVHRIRMFRSEFRDQVRRCQLVIDIGEGDSFADIYGFKRFFYYWLSKNIVCALGKPLILAPQTIGPFNGTVARLLARQVMRRCKVVFARDHLSTAYLMDMGITANTQESIDVAFQLPYTAPRLSPSGKVRVGINVSGLLFNGGYTGQNQFDLTIDYPATMRQLLSWFIDRPDVEVHLVSHVVEPDMPVEDDYGVAKKLAGEFPAAIVVPPFARPGDAKSYISTLDFFVGARMHACIAAFSAGIAVVPIAYSRKFNGLFESLDYRWLVDCKKQSADEINSAIQSSFNSREKLAADVQNSSAVRTLKMDRYRTTIDKELTALIAKEGDLIR